MLTVEGAKVVGGAAVAGVKNLLGFGVKDAKPKPDKKPAEPKK